MNKKTIIIAFFSLAFCLPAFSQTSLPAVNHNADRDRMHRIITESTTVEMPQFATEALKTFAKTKGYNETGVMRNTILLRPLYNKNLSKEDRLFAAQVLMRMCDNPSTTIPVELVSNAIKEISKTN